MSRSPVIQALYEHWRLVKNPAKRARISRLLVEAHEQRLAIDAFRKMRDWERKHDTCRPEINGTRMTGEMHPLEYEACRILCPQLTIGHGKAKTKAWEWVMRQPWAADLKTSPLGRQFY